MLPLGKAAFRNGQYVMVFDSRPLIKEEYEMSKSVKMGSPIVVGNKNAHRLAAREYIALKIEEQDGKNERWILFTHTELSKIKGIDAFPFSMQMKPGRLYPVEIYGRAGYLVAVKYNDGNVKTLFLTQKMINRLENRARKNREDIPNMSRLADLFD